MAGSVLQRSEGGKGRRGGQGRETVSLTFSPLQLLPQHLEVAAGRRVDQPKGTLGAADADLVPVFELESGLPVEGDEHFVSAVHVRLHPNRRRCGNDDWSVRES